MPEPIVEVQIKPSADKLRLEWGIPFSQGEWAFPLDTLEVRLFAYPFPELGKPDLITPVLDDIQITHTTDMSISIPSRVLGGSRGVGRSAPGFLPDGLTVVPGGHISYYSLRIDLNSIRITDMEGIRPFQWNGR